MSDCAVPEVLGASHAGLHGFGCFCSALCAFGTCKEKCMHICIFFGRFQQGVPRLGKSVIHGLGAAVNFAADRDCFCAEIDIFGKVLHRDGIFVLHCA